MFVSATPPLVLCIYNFVLDLFHLLMKEQIYTQYSTDILKNVFKAEIPKIFWKEHSASTQELNVLT